MSTDVVSTQAFQERIFSRIRDSIGDLMSDEDLRKLLESAMQKAFFDPVKTSVGYHDRVDPPLFVTMVRDLMRPMVEAAVQKWVAEHPEDVARVLKEVLEAGIFEAMVRHFKYQTQGPLANMMTQLQAKGVL